MSNIERRFNVSPSYLSDIREHYEQLEYLPKINYKNVCRYKNLRTLQDETGKIYHETWFQKFINKSNADEYFIVTKIEEDRLDIISYKYYNTPKYWWVIAMANDIIDPLCVRRGTILRIPKFNSLFDIDGPLYGRV